MAQSPTTPSESPSQATQAIGCCQGGANAESAACCKSEGKRSGLAEPTRKIMTIDELAALPALHLIMRSKNLLSLSHTIDLSTRRSTTWETAMPTPPPCTDQTESAFRAALSVRPQNCRRSTRRQKRV